MATEMEVRNALNLLPDSALSNILADLILSKMPTLEQTLTNKTLTSPTLTTPTLSTPTITAPVITGAGSAILSTLTSGTFKLTPTEITDGGAVAMNDSGIYVLNKTTPKIEGTIAAPGVGSILFIVQTDAGTAGHTVTLTAGTWNGTNTVATLNAADEALFVIGLSATRYYVVVNNGSVAFSGP
jgi:hypothetical protein